MSRIGKLPIPKPANVTVTFADSLVTVKGPMGELQQKIHNDIKLEISENQILVTRTNDEKDQRSSHGLYRALIANMVEGVSKGFTIQQELVGVGYKAESNGQILEMSLGYSHQIHFEMPKEITVECKTEKRANPIITLKSCDKQLIGQVAAKIRSFRKPEPYKGKGIKFVGEVVRRKSGKSASV
ncbi:MAG TPA: 50S ribosomal protein L6 [Bacteroidales bacterium]|nr:50S ribosomal protein L6 [Bacteroidales bacterium]